MFFHCQSALNTPIQQLCYYFGLVKRRKAWSEKTNQWRERGGYQIVSQYILSTSFLQEPSSYLFILEYWSGKILLSSRLLNPLTPASDEHVNSPYTIHTLSSKQMVRLLKFIRYKIFLDWTPNSCKQFSRKHVAAKGEN